MRCKYYVHLLGSIFRGSLPFFLFWGLECRRDSWIWSSCLWPWGRNWWGWQTNNIIGLCERNELLFKALLFQLFCLLLPRFILVIHMQGETGVSVVSSSGRAYRWPPWPYNTFKSISSNSCLGSHFCVSGNVSSCLPCPHFPLKCVCFPTEFSALSALTRIGISVHVKCSHLARPLYTLFLTTIVKRFSL